MRPGSPEWNRLVAASKVSAILGLSPSDSPLTMWLRMKGQLPSDDGSNAKDKARGHYLEGGVLQWWKDRHKVAAGREQEFCTVPGIPWGAATPDLLTTDDFGNLCVVDAKTAATADDWGTPGTDEAPAYYAAQALWQLAMVPEAQVAYIAVLFGRPQLGFEERFAYEANVGQLCSVDTIAVLVGGAAGRGPRCMLGKFTPVRYVAETGAD